MTMDKVKYSINLNMEPIKLPPVSDILVLARKHPQGKIGVMESFRFIAPDEFEMFDVNSEHPVVEAILVNKKILARVPKDVLLTVLAEHVFPYMSQGEAVKVDLNVKLTFENIKGEYAP